MIYLSKLAAFAVNVGNALHDAPAINSIFLIVNGMMFLLEDLLKYDTAVGDGLSMGQKETRFLKESGLLKLRYHIYLYAVREAIPNSLFPHSVLHPVVPNAEEDVVQSNVMNVDVVFPFQHLMWSQLFICP